MKTIAICSLFVLFAMVAGLVATTPAAFADHPEVTIVPAAGSGAPGCEETADGCYIPSTATVAVGGTVIMSNTDTAAHTFTAGTPDDGPDGIFDTSLLMAGSSFEWSPTEAGEYPYFCMVHPWMQGTIIAEAEGAEEPADDHGDHMDDAGHLITEASATGMMSDGTKVSVWTTEPMAGEMMEIHVEFVDSEHVNHDITVTQNGETVLDDMGAHHHEGSGMHTTAPLSSSDPVDITITFQGYGVSDPKTGPIGEEVVFTSVVPEFGTIAMMILAVAIISIVAVTAKSRIVPRF
ncbi:blue copper domain-containing protein [Marine Group I thaumarchaeote SCGC AAA799-E16]|uniref:Blue copper domain-containing protein n=1 Tax=Marine Group I thaumarchaeote SCGC AAA799-E16 TaxID=1502292 RepID=A0A081S7H4_9ARCH|nr:blue copper domain-containing protein [Marine Group I thaumarchaeote SCGC AAA799-E16]